MEKSVIAFFSACKSCSQLIACYVLYAGFYLESKGNYQV